MAEVVLDLVRIDDADGRIRYNSLESQVDGWRHDREDDIHWTVGESQLFFTFTGKFSSTGSPSEDNNQT